MRYCMNKLANKIEAIIGSNNFPFFVLFVIMLILHQAVITNFGDEQSVRNAVTWSSAWQSYTRYLMNMNNRFIPMALYFTLPLFPEIVWKTLDIAIVMLIAVSLSLLFRTEAQNPKTLNWVIVGLILLYPMKDMSTAGWLATTTGFSWILAFVFVSFLPIRKFYKKESISLGEYIIYIIATIIASNSQQPAMIISVLYALFWADIFYRFRKIPRFLTLQFCTAFSLLIFFTFHVATINRFEVEKHWWIDFDMVSVIQKIKMGFGSTFSRFFGSPYAFSSDLGSPDPIFILLCGIILYAVIRKYKHPLYRTISAIPFGLSVFPLLAPIIYRMFPSWERWIKYQYDLILYNDEYITIQDRLTLFDYTVLENYLPIILHLLLVGLICISLYLIFENTRKTILVIAIFLLGVFSRLIMGFSPTLLASNTRTFLFLYAAMAVCILFIFKELNEKRREQQSAITTTSKAVDRRHIVLLTTLTTFAALLFAAAILADYECVEELSQSAIAAMNKNNSQMKWHVDEVTEQRSGFRVSGWAFKENEPQKRIKTYVILRDPENNQYFRVNTAFVARPDVGKEYGKEHVASGFYSRCSKWHLKNGRTYDIYIWYVNDKNNILIFTGKKLTR